MVLLPSLLVEDAEKARQNRERVASGFGNDVYDKGGVGTSLLSMVPMPSRQEEAADGGIGGWQCEYEVDADHITRMCGIDFEYDEEEGADLPVPSFWRQILFWPRNLRLSGGEQHLTYIDGEASVRKWI